MHDDAHVLALGLEADPVLPEGEFAPLQEVVDWIAANGGAPVPRAHLLERPAQRAVVGDARGSCGIEVWNSGCELELGRGDASLHWDEVLERGRPLTALATDDSHHPGYDSGFAWTWVRAAERTQEAILAALAAGRVLRLDRTGDPRRRGLRGRGGRPLQPGGGGDALLAAVGAARGRTRAGSATRTTPQVLERDDEGRHHGRASPRARTRRRTDVSRCVDRTGRKAWTNALWIA